MTKEPYNLFSDAGSTLPGGSLYDDMLVVVKAMVEVNGGRVVIPEDLLMFVDKDEHLIAHDEFIDGVNHKVFTVGIKERNQSHVGQIRHESASVVDEPAPRWARNIALVIAITIVAAFWYLVFQLIRWAF